MDDSVVGVSPTRKTEMTGMTGTTGRTGRLGCDDGDDLDDGDEGEIGSRAESKVIIFLGFAQERHPFKLWNIEIEQRQNLKR